MRFSEKIKNFVKEHPMEIMIGVGGVVVFACGAIVGAEIKGKMDLDIFDDSVAKTAALAGAAGMGCVGNFIHDNIPEADKMIAQYCGDHETDFWQLFRECGRIKDLENIIGKEIPCPVK